MVRVWVFLNAAARILRLLDLYRGFLEFFRTRRTADGWSILCLMGAIGWMVRGFAYAQTQDFINGSTATQIKDLADRVTRIEGRMDYILGGVFMLLIANLVQIAASKQRRDRGR